MDTETFLNTWKVVSDKIGGQFVAKEFVNAHVGGSICKIEIKKPEEKGWIIIEQSMILYGKNSYQYNLITISYEAIVSTEFNLQIIKISLLDRIFGLGEKTGDELIDSKFYIRSNTWTKVSVIFKNDDFKKFLLENSDMFFKINTINKEISIIFKVLTVNMLYEVYPILRQLVKYLKIY